MPKTELKENLEGLKTEVAKLNADDDPRTIHLNGIIQDVELKIMDAEDIQESSVTIASDIEKIIKDYEVEYPKITRVLNRIMNLLSNMGI